MVPAVWMARTRVSVHDAGYHENWYGRTAPVNRKTRAHFGAHRILGSRCVYGSRRCVGSHSRVGSRPECGSLALCGTHLEAGSRGYSGSRHDAGYLGLCRSYPIYGPARNQCQNRNRLSTSHHATARFRCRSSHCTKWREASAMTCPANARPPRNACSASRSRAWGSLVPQ